jgi:hypothetical protein
MAHKNKTPAAVATATGAKGSSDSAPIHKKYRPDNNSIWAACRDALAADAARKAQGATKLEAAAARLGFARSEDERFERRCPHCGGRLALRTTKNGDVRASEFVAAPACPAIPNIRLWLRAEGFQSIAKGGAP